jgi:hypothetical membrane protein
MDVAPLRAVAIASTAGRERLAGIALFTMAAGFLTVIMLGASMVPGYDMGTAAISDLGVAPETSALFNAALILVGILNLAAAVLLFGGGHRVLLVAFTAAGSGAVGAGFFPLGSGGPHGLFALVAFVAFNLEAIGVATIVHGPMRILSLLAGAVGLLFVVLMVIGDAGNAAAFGVIGHGGTERMIVYPVMLWMLALGGHLMAGATRPSEPVGARLRPGSGDDHGVV